MNDFLIHFGRRGDADTLARMLRGRPGVSEHKVVTFDFPWGRVAVQPPVAPGYAPLRHPDGLVGCVGRPRFLGVEHESQGPCGFNGLFRDRLRAAGPQSVADALTGMFAVYECSVGRVRVLTDPLGFMPVYMGCDAIGRVAAVGTHLESVAALAGRQDDFDPVSLGDLLVHQHVTFPYTTRRGVTELHPASLTEFPVGPGGDVRGGDVRTTVLWEPREPAAGDVPRAAELDEQLERALRAAAADVTRGARSVATTLSGGLDSRLVLAAMAGVASVAGAITYATRDNNEVNVARRVAAAAGVPHRIAWRGEEFYAELMPRAVGLLGSELRGECHGFCVVDNALDREFDLVVGGFFSDTLFKGHYMPSVLRERVRRRSRLYRARRAAGKALRSLGLLPPVKPQSPHFWDKARAMESRLAEDVREALRERRRVRLEQVRSLRPESAEEWVRFWPAGRGDGAYGPQANMRLFTSDELFFHRGLVELAARVPMHEKLRGRLTRRVFPKLYGELGQIENAATGIPAGAKPISSHWQLAKAEGSSNAGSTMPRSRFPWNDVNDSWVDWELLQKHSATWSAYRAALADSAAVDVLETVLPDAADFIQSYRDEAGHLFNRAAVQLAYAVDRSLRQRDPAASAAPASDPPAERPAAGAARLARRPTTSSPANAP